MDALHSYVRGRHPRRAAAVVATVAIVEVLALAVFGTFDVVDSAMTEGVVFAFVFGVVPGAVGAVCGGLKLGYPAAATGGVVPGVAFYVVVAVGATLRIGNFGGGDAPLLPFSAFLAAGSFVWATTGFALGTAGVLLAGWLRERTD